MSYPEPRYLGETGEVSATFRPVDHAPEVLYPNGNAYHYLATGGSTGGLFGLYRCVLGPEPGGPGPHFHRTMAESFYVLTGTLRIFNGERWLDAQPGDFVHVPIGGLHGFRNESGQSVSMLIHFAPGAPRERYFEGLRDWAVNGRPGEEEAAAFYSEHDNLWR